MPLLKLQYGVDWKEFKELDRFFVVSAEVLGNLKPLYEKLLPTIRREIQHQFQREGHPEKWRRLKSTYLASFKKRKSKFPTAILKLTGKMWKAATQTGAFGNIASITGEGLVWGIDLDKIPYARIHDQGGKVGGRRRANIPKREFLKLTKRGIDRIVQKAHRFIRSRMNIK